MLLVIPSETATGEHRVALVPDGAARLVKDGHEVRVEAGAGSRAGFPDSDYERAGATVVAGPAVYAGAELVCRVQAPSMDEAALLPPGTTLLALLAPARNAHLLALLADLQVTALALELVPRITRAQSMDVLSSQSTVAGYKAVLVGAAALPKFLPMLTTAAGTVSPARVFVIGAGVAGLQAIATARRLGGVVSAFDVRPAAREQVQSLGASFVAAELVAQGAETSGGYARAQSDDDARRTRDALATHLREVDLVVTTAQVPGRTAPRLITEEMLGTMRPGAVIVDLAAESGGNCALTRPGETVQAGPVTILGPLNLAASVPYHASQMFSRNVLTLVSHLSHEGTLRIDATDEITGPMTVVRDGAVIAPPTP
jgi:H+-translocating NAD(P) transhydrogenase subunit alpha